jgi:hypothetical protein
MIGKYRHGPIAGHRPKYAGDIKKTVDQSHHTVGFNLTMIRNAQRRKATLQDVSTLVMYSHLRGGSARVSTTFAVRSEHILSTKT